MKTKEQIEATIKEHGAIAKQHRVEIDSLGQLIQQNFSRPELVKEYNRRVKNHIEFEQFNLGVMTGLKWVIDPMYT